MAFLEKVEKQDLNLLGEDLGLRRNALTGKKRGKNRQLASNRKATVNTRTSCAEDPKKASSNYQVSIIRADEPLKETSPTVLMAKAIITMTTPIKEEKKIDYLRVVYVKSEKEVVNAVIATGAQIPVVRADVIEGQSVDNRRTIQITSAFGEYEMGELKGSNMEMNDLRHGVVPISKYLVNGMLICSSDYEGVIENLQLVRNYAVLRESSKKEDINSINSKSVCSQEVVTDPHPKTYTQSLSNAPNENLVAVEINAWNVQTNGQDIKESERKITLSGDSLVSENNFILAGSFVECWKSNLYTLLNDSDEHVNNQFQTFGITKIVHNIVITLKRQGNITEFVIIRKTPNFVDGVRVVNTMRTTPIWDIDLFVKIMCIMPEANVARSEITLTCIFKNGILYSNMYGQSRNECISNFIDSILVPCFRNLIEGIVNLELKIGL
ncbi:hypothetical protein TNCV_2716141 [Trichonephila clavipes]|nr:hypothetical protein TNCV_2716141 [Trichonephila clavipes]